MLVLYKEVWSEVYIKICLESGLGSVLRGSGMDSVFRGIWCEVCMLGVWSGVYNSLGALGQLDAHQLVSDGISQRYTITFYSVITHFIQNYSVIYSNFYLSPSLLSPLKEPILCCLENSICFLS